MDSQLPKNPRVPPSFDLSAARKIQQIIQERNNRLQKKNISVVQEVPDHPDGLLPIHLRSEPLPQLALEDFDFALRNGARNIIKRRCKDFANLVQDFRDQPTRARSLFFDESAVESDEEGGEIPSRATTPSRSRPTSPPRTPTYTPSVQVPINRKKSKLKKPTEHCKACNRFFDCIKELEIHLNSRKHLKQIRNSSSTHCKQCNHFFTSKHNFVTHKCRNIFRKVNSI